MKRIIKAVLRGFRRVVSPLFRPVMARIDVRISHIVAGTVNARMMPPIIESLAISLHRLERIEDTLARAEKSAGTMAEEVDLVLNGLSREVFRLQAQVELLRRAVGDDFRSSGNGLSIVAESGEEAPVRLPAPPAERAKVG